MNNSFISNFRLRREISRTIANFKAVNASTLFELIIKSKKRRVVILKKLTIADCACPPIGRDLRFRTPKRGMQILNRSIWSSQLQIDRGKEINPIYQKQKKKDQTH